MKNKHTLTKLPQGNLEVISLFAARGDRFCQGEKRGTCTLNSKEHYATGSDDFGAILSLKMNEKKND